MHFASTKLLNSYENYAIVTEQTHLRELSDYKRPLFKPNYPQLDILLQRSAIRSILSSHLTSLFLSRGVIRLDALLSLRK